jgi:hypothetical protein
MRKIIISLCSVLAVALVIFLFQNKEPTIVVQPSFALPLTSFEDADYTVTIPDKALIKNYLTVSLETDPGTACKLTFIAPSGTIHEMETIADVGGLCEWRWKLEESYGEGHGRLIFTINGVSDTHFINIRKGF